MTLTPCTCGRRPAMTFRNLKWIGVFRVVCVCGNKGGEVTFIKPEDADRTRQVTADGWNLSL